VKGGTIPRDWTNWKCSTNAKQRTPVLVRSADCSDSRLRNQKGFDVKNLTRRTSQKYIDKLNPNYPQDWVRLPDVQQHAQEWLDRITQQIKAIEVKFAEGTDFRPWVSIGNLVALEHWGLVQKRLALEQWIGRKVRSSRSPAPRSSIEGPVVVQVA
jgi:hypothetical protein